jgi:hypothetical protein
MQIITTWLIGARSQDFINILFLTSCFVDFFVVELLLRLFDLS